MSQSRRKFLISSSVLFIAGCQKSVTSGLPTTDWPSAGARPPVGTAYIPVPEQGTPQHIPDEPKISGSLGTPANPIPRSQWARYGPYAADLNPMNGIRRITLHHEGQPQPVTFTDGRTTAQRLEIVRNSHRGRGWADIGYHFIVDRAGRVWEGRNVAYQGAHVRDHNEHNLGIMCLGNFDLQSPSEAQLKSLRDTVRIMRQRYKVSTSMIRTHQEINPTACPGRNLQPRIAAMRSQGMFA